MIIDFSELGDGQTFEYFCGAFLSKFGFIIEKNGSIGPDGGCDLIVSEPSIVNKNVRYRWLVSCKNFSKSKKSVSANDLSLNRGLLDKFKCHGVMVLATTQFTNGCEDNLRGIFSDIRDSFVLINCLDIEKELLRDLKYCYLLKQYFPKSYNKLVKISKESCKCGQSEQSYILTTRGFGLDTQIYEYLVCDICKSMNTPQAHECDFYFHEIGY
ncbi:restriction endonuclease [Pseudoalteromonas sp. SG43-4]|uniref:restriction endonuclease n=1 Tax=Pseudoalteromonas sp. SG43-4 TaxID=2760969 RepID=UPI0016045BEB|nr:restriction endonuclease [Pseudoalteromonas sp. SG43-4]MBB1432065.1 restriction endonuclease [Pseudoalteromonas sp. SG43-4]